MEQALNNMSATFASHYFEHTRFLCPKALLRRSSLLAKQIRYRIVMSATLPAIAFPSPVLASSNHSDFAFHQNSKRLQCECQTCQHIHSTIDKFVIMRLNTAIHLLALLLEARPLALSFDLLSFLRSNTWALRRGRPRNFHHMRSTFFCASTRWVSRYSWTS